MAGGNATFANENVTMADENAAFANENVLFADRNAAARTFGRAHRRRPYHFSHGSCHKIAGEVFADEQNQGRLRGGRI